MAMMRQTMWDIVKLHGRGEKLYWRRPVSASGVVMVIPIVDGVPVVAKFEIVDKGAVVNEEHNLGQ